MHFSDLERNRIYDLKANILKIEKCHSERLAGDLGHCEYSMTPDFNSAAACKKSFLTIFSVTWPLNGSASPGAKTCSERGVFEHLSAERRSKHAEVP